MLRGAIAALCLSLPAAGSSAMERTALVFGGPAMLNDWGELVTGQNLTYSEAVVVGVAGGLRWDIRPRFRFSMEAQLARYFGAQESWEVNLVPAMIHYVPRNPPGPLESVGFGLGFSYASEPPAIELARGGDTTREKWYWAIEAAFDGGVPGREWILRIHHRSTGASTIGNGRSTNALVMGLRQSF
jgi:hypothetical protein